MPQFSYRWVQVLHTVSKFVNFFQVIVIVSLAGSLPYFKCSKWCLLLVLVLLALRLLLIGLSVWTFLCFSGIYSCLRYGLGLSQWCCAFSFWSNRVFRIVLFQPGLAWKPRLWPGLRWLQCQARPKPSKMAWPRPWLYIYVKTKCMKKKKHELRKKKSTEPTCYYSD